MLQLDAQGAYSTPLAGVCMSNVGTKGFEPSVIYRKVLILLQVTYKRYTECLLSIGYS